MNKTTIKQAIRVVGHLLETNGTTRVFARNSKSKQIDHFHPKACKFCISAACDVVAVNILGIARDDYDSLSNFEDTVSDLLNNKFSPNDSFCSHILLWDNADKIERKHIIEVLKNV